MNRYSNHYETVDAQTDGTDEKRESGTNEKTGSGETAAAAQPTGDESEFVWLAAVVDVDSVVSPTVKSGSQAVEEASREGPAALVTDGNTATTSQQPTEILKETDLSTSGETPVVRIVEPEGEPPDPRTLTASLSATEMSVGDALESVSH